MSDEFDRFLANALAPAQRDPDRGFLGQVQARIALEDRLSGARASAIRRIGLETLAVLGVGAGLLWLSRAPEVAGFVADMPWLAAGTMMAGFGLLVTVLTSRGAGSPGLGPARR